jgi:D-amino-acid dehydrogenase
VSASPSVDVAVVGGGLVGTSVAYELACAGASVALIDASLPGRASDAGAGIISPETFQESDRQRFEFGLEAGRHLRVLVSRLAADGAEAGPETFAQCGSLTVALAEHEDPWFTEAHTLITAHSPDLTEIGADEAREMFPPLGRVWRALHNPSAARVDGRLLCHAVREAAGHRGVRFVAMEATGVERRHNRVVAVRGADDVVPCGALVLAGGAWSGVVTGWFGTELPVTPTKGQIVHVVLPGDVQSTRWPIVQPILNFYLVPWPGGRVACGGTFEPEAGFDVRPTAAGVRDLLRECVTIAPGLADATVLEVRVGLRPTSADDRPLLGPVPGLSNVHVCTGHGANGLLLGPYSAALVAAGVIGPAPDAVVPYDVARVFSP